MKKLWTLANKEERYLDLIDKMSTEEIDSIPDRGNGKAEFIGLMSKDDYDRYERDKDPTWEKFYRMIKNL